MDFLLVYLLEPPNIRILTVSVQPGDLEILRYSQPTIYIYIHIIYIYIYVYYIYIIYIYIHV